MGNQQTSFGGDSGGGPGKNEKEKVCFPPFPFFFNQIELPFANQNCSSFPLFHENPPFMKTLHKSELFFLSKKIKTEGTQEMGTSTTPNNWNEKEKKDRSTSFK